MLCERRVDGLLIVPAGDDHRYVLPELRSGTRAVFIDRVTHRNGFRLAVVGFDDLELGEMLELPVTIVAHDPTELGRQATELVLRRLARDDSPPQRVVLPTVLIARGSGEVAP